MPHLEDVRRHLFLCGWHTHVAKLGSLLIAVHDQAVAIGSRDIVFFGKIELFLEVVQSEVLRCVHLTAFAKEIGRRDLREKHVLGIGMRKERGEERVRGKENRKAKQKKMKEKRQETGKREGKGARKIREERKERRERYRERK